MAETRADASERRRSPRRGPGTGLEFFDDCEVRERPEEPEEVKAPEPVKRVRVLHPFLVSHDGTAHWPQAVAEVPESVAADWLLNRWVTDDID
jgi:hypothetical protein